MPHKSGPRKLVLAIPIATNSLCFRLQYYNRTY
nr:MAG TPA: hypothetical protein [Caudoviricetes sp.]